MGVLIKSSLDESVYQYAVSSEDGDNSEYRKFIQAYEEFKLHAESKLSGVRIVDLIISDKKGGRISLSVLTESDR